MKNKSGKLRPETAIPKDNKPTAEETTCSGNCKNGCKNKKTQVKKTKAR